MDDNKLTITFAYSDREFSATIHGDSAIPEVVDVLKGLLLASGFHTDSIEEYIGGI